MGIPTLELHPGVRLGPFPLGSPICDALAEVEQQQSLFLSTAVKYSEQDPLAWDIVVAFPHLGFHLCFDPRHQRLHKIEVYDITRLHLRYGNNVIGGPSLPATFARMYTVLGPTFPGHFNKDTGTYTLSYPGISLFFRIPPRYASYCLQCQELPLEFPDGTTPVVSRIVLHLGELPPQSPQQASTPAEAKSAVSRRAVAPRWLTVPRGGVSALSKQMLAMPGLPLPYGGLYMEEVQVRLGESIFFTAGQQELCFGFSPQDVWSELGRPCSIVQREAGSMLIHLPTSASHSTTQQQEQQKDQQLPQQQQQLHGSHGAPGDFAWSYFNRGIDVIFDAQTKSVTKFVLHTNAPGHPDFNEYVKCNFTIPAPEHAAPSLEAPALSNVAKIGAVTSDSKWEDVQRLLGGSGCGPIQTAGSLQISFGPTFVYGLKGVTFEVMRNGYISTVTLFQVGDSQRSSEPAQSYSS